MAVTGARDVLAEIDDGRTTVAAVEELYRAVMASDRAAEVQLLLGLSSVEWTAFCQGACWDDLVRFRREGWPRSCGRCGGPLRVADFGWLVHEQDGGVVLVHVTCP